MPFKAYIFIYTFKIVIGRHVLLPTNTNQFCITYVMYVYEKTIGLLNRLIGF